jgi:hypothetical protein
MTPAQFVHRSAVYVRETNRVLGTFLLPSIIFGAGLPLLLWRLGVSPSTTLATATLCLVWLLGGLALLRLGARSRADALALLRWLSRGAASPVASRHPPAQRILRDATIGSRKRPERTTWSWGLYSSFDRPRHRAIAAGRTYRPGVLRMGDRGSARWTHVDDRGRPALAAARSSFRARLPHLRRVAGGRREGFRHSRRPRERRLRALRHQVVGAGGPPAVRARAIAPSRRDAGRAARARRPRRCGRSPRRSRRGRPA